MDCRAVLTKWKEGMPFRQSCKLLSLKMLTPVSPGSGGPAECGQRRRSRSGRDAAAGPTKVEDSKELRFGGWGPYGVPAARLSAAQNRFRAGIGDPLL